MIVGSGPYADKLQKLVSDLALDDIVIFTGLVDNSQTAYYYKAADFFISASTSETQGLTYIEALASGTPVLATDNAYLQSLITEPVFGRLFASDDDIAATILAAITETPSFDQARYDQKLYEISAENFALRVYEFYLDKIISNDQYLAEKGSLFRDGQLESFAKHQVKQLKPLPGHQKSRLFCEKSNQTRQNSQ